ncbi:MAG TPA: hypothetical protein VIM11_09155 [Tepidisphaeraceae bacterium]|jgi:hypothetical protein
MNQDPIVEEARRAGRALFSRFNNDMTAVCEYLRQRTDEAARNGLAVVSREPRNPRPRPVVSKRVG